jgi:hypothetical protein
VRRLLRWLGITPVLAARYTEHGSGLGVFRWFVERTLSWLHAFGRLRRRLDRDPAPPVAVEAFWDGDTTGWFVVLTLIYVERTPSGPR